MKNCYLRVAFLGRPPGFLCVGFGVALLLGPTGKLSAAGENPKNRAVVARIADPLIRAGLAAAITQNLIPAATEEFYPGYFNITADGSSYGGATWPDLDSWQMAGAYLLLGRTRLVLVNGRHVPVLSPGVRMPHPRGLSSRAWISTKVALAKAGLIPGLQWVAPATHIPQVFPKAA